MCVSARPACAAPSGIPSASTGAARARALTPGRGAPPSRCSSDRQCRSLCFAGALGEPEEEILERRELRRQREDRDVRLAERERELADVVLLCLEGQAMLAERRVVDAVLGPCDLQRARVVA